MDAKFEMVRNYNMTACATHGTRQATNDTYNEGVWL